MQLQHSCSGAAWRRRQSGAEPSTTTAQRVAPAIAQQRHAAAAAAIAGPGLLLQHHRRRWPAGRCSSTPADSSGGGDVVRPSAKAAAPPVSAAPLLPDLAGGAANGHHAAGGAASSNSSSSNGAGVRSSSYSELYKAINSTHYSGAAPLQQQQPDSSSLPPQLQDHAAEPATAAAAAAADAALLGSTTPSHAAGAASDGVGAGTDAAAAGGVPPPPATAAAAADAAGVEDAIRKAQQALAAAESSLSSIHKLRSAQPPSKWASALAALRSVATAVGVGAFLVASHAFGLGWQWAGATIGALALAALAIKQQTITEAGAVAAAAASLATLGCSLRFGMVLLVVSYSSFKLRQFKEARAAPDLSTMLSRVATAGQQQAQAQVQQVTRDWLEIACIAAVPTMLAIAYGAMAGCLDLPLGSLPNVETWRADLLTLLQGAVLGWYACVCGDAWSSELGALSADQPRLLTTLAPVRRGTHGGVTLLGLSGAAAGGLLAGLVFYCAAVLSPTLWVFEAQRAAAMAQWRVIPLGLMAGLFGSLLDSLLGATLQFTGYDPATSSLTNRPGPKVQRISGLAGCTRWLTGNVVDVLAASVTAALTALAALATFA